MNDKPLVSMITYCYNGERFVHRYFDAILSQTYDNIELIFFNNGSEDKTGEIAEKYKLLLERRGICVRLIHYKENQNTCRLKQEGFQLARGQYIFGCDSDDIIHPTYIEEMCGYLLSHPEKGIVFCQLNIIDETTGKKIGLYKVAPNAAPKGAFVDMLHDRNSYYTAISYMFSKEQFLRTNHDLQFEISDYGENPQIQLPLLYHDLQGYIEKPLGDYYVRPDSYSGKFRTDYRKQVRSYLDSERKILITLDRIQPEEKEQYEQIVKKRWRNSAFYAALHTNDKDTIRQCYSLLREVKGVGFKERFAFYFRPLYLKLRSAR